jgi:uncharacterized protein YjiS (DUF1127 family)
MCVLGSGNDVREDRDRQPLQPRPDAAACRPSDGGGTRAPRHDRWRRWAIWRWYQVRRTTRQLSHLPDHMLKDIGLSRSMLISASMRRAREEEEIRRRLNAY